jgi:hypothetical protein
MVIRSCFFMLPLNPNPRGRRTPWPPPSTGPPPSLGRCPPSTAMLTDQDAEALRLRLETLIKEADNTEAKAVVARCRVQAARQLLEEEQAVAADLDRKSAAAKRLLPPSLSSLTTADTPNGTSYDSTVVSNLHI